MEAQTQPESLKNDSLPSLPSLSPEIQSLYNSLNNDMRALFIKVFRFQWGVVNRKRSAPVVSFWCVDLLRLRAGLTSSELSTMVFLYQLSHKGAKYIHSDVIYNSVIMPGLTYASKQAVLNDLKHYGYITRSTRDPGQPYSQRAQHNKQPVYIRLSSKGINLIEKIERDFYNLTMNTSLNELTGQ
jgi:hypothetical protein